MTLKNKIWNTVAGLIMVVICSACGPFTSSVEPDNKESNAVRFTVGEVVGHTIKQQGVAITSNEAWTIEVDYLTPEGSEGWCSFSATSGKGNKNIFMSFGTNTLEVSRSLTLRVVFPKETIELPFTQLSQYDQLGEETTIPQWLELPKFSADYERYYFSKHMLASESYTKRSFSLLYDSNIYHSMWVAYPISKLHTPGSGSRSDDWGRYDSNIPTSKQIYLKSSFNGNYDRGHLCPAATRFHPNTTENCRELSVPTNMSPQLSGLNQEKWAVIEGEVRSWGAGCDTLYVVTGAVFQTVGGNEAVNYTYGRSDSSKRVAIPNYYYKALLQRRISGTNSSYSAMALWVPHTSTDNSVPTRNFVISIDDLEARTGIDFFHNLDDATEQSVEKIVNYNYWQGL